jgi:hypothetical protein
MYVDRDLVLSDAQAITSASAASENYIDTKAKGAAVSPGARIKVAVPVAFTIATGTPTLVVAFQSDSDTAFGTAVTHFSTSAALVAALTKGTVLLDFQVPKSVGRYIRVYYTLASGTYTLGNLDAMIALDTDNTMDKNL